MADKRSIARARSAMVRGISPGAQAGEYLREGMHHVREAKHGALSANMEPLWGPPQGSYWYSIAWPHFWKNR